jgi:hypothetical protein
VNDLAAQTPTPSLAELKRPHTRFDVCVSDSFLNFASPRSAGRNLSGKGSISRKVDYLVRLAVRPKPLLRCGRKHSVSRTYDYGSGPSSVRSILMRHGSRSSGHAGNGTRRILCTLLLSIPLAAAPACSDDGDQGKKGGTGGSSGSAGSPSASGCPWIDGCSSNAPEGSYDCRGSTMVTCVNGEWETVVNCAATSTTISAREYFCRCEAGCGLSGGRCAFADNTCEGHSYDR